jgi:hypothetical protein
MSFLNMFLELMLPQSRFARFPLGLRKLMHRCYDKFETLFYQALTSWPN